MKPDVVINIEHHPLSGVGRTIHEVPSGLCLTEIIELYNTDIPLTQLWVNIDNGPLIPSVVNAGLPDEWSPWDTIRPKKGHVVNIRSRPFEGVVPIVLGLVAVAAVAYGISTLLQKPSAKSPKSGRTSYSLTGSSNEAPEVGQIVPYVAGRMKIYPLRASEPYTTTEGGQQYLHAVFACGFGPLYFEDIGVGDTTIIAGSAPIPVTGIVPDNRITFPGMTMEVREGRASDQPTTLYPSAVHEAGPNVELTKKDGSVITQILTQGVTKLWWELTWPEGLYRQKTSGGTEKAETTFKIEYRRIGDSGWITRVDMTKSGNTQSSYRQSWAQDVSVSATGWESRVTNRTSPPENNRRHNKVWWTGFQGRTHLPPCNRDDQALVAIRVRASQNAQGILNRLYCVVSRYARAWNGNSWVEQPTAGPASTFRDILQNRAANDGEVFSDSQIDLASLQTWGNHNIAAGRTVGLVFSDEGTGMDRLEAVASSARASVSNFDAKRGVIEDVEQLLPVQAISPSNSSDFVKFDSYRRIPHALRVQFMDETHGWDRQQIIVCDDGYSMTGGGLAPSVFDDLDLTQTGITKPARAHDEGRMHLAENRFRRWYASGKMNHQALWARRGDLVYYSNHAFLVGLSSGYITSTTVSGGNTTAIDIEWPVIMEAGEVYCVVIRSVSTSGLHQGIEVVVNTVVGSQTHLTFSSAVPLSISNIRVGDMFQYGLTHLAKHDCIVKSVESSGPGEFNVVVVPHAQPEINNSISGPMGPYDPGTTTPPGKLKVPAAPVLIFVRRGDLIVPREPMGIREIKLIAIVNLPPSKTAPTHSMIQYREKGESDWVSAPLMPISTELPFIVPFGFIYEVQAFSASIDEGVLLCSKASNMMEVDAKSIPQTIVDVARVTGLELAGQGNDTNFTGKDAHVIWRMTSSSGSVELGDEPTGGGSTWMDPTFSCWNVTIYSGPGVTIETRREEQVTEPSYYYSYDKNWMDANLIDQYDPFSAVARQFRIDVCIVDTYGRRGIPASITVQNPAPPLPFGLHISANIGTLWVSCNLPTDPDWIGMKVWASMVSGFVPEDNVNLLGKVNSCADSFNTFVDKTPVLPGTTYYIRMALFDAFGDDIDLLNVTAEYEQRTGTVDISDLPIYTFDPPPLFLIDADGGTLTWTASTVHILRPASGITSDANIDAGSVPWGGRTIYVSYQMGTTSLFPTIDVITHTYSDRTLMAVWSIPGRQADLTVLNGKAGIAGDLIYAHTITGQALAVDTAIINSSAQIGMAVIESANIAYLEAAKILARTVFTQVLYVGAASGGRITIDGEYTVLNVWDDQPTPRLRVQIGKLGPNPTDWGLALWDWDGTSLVDFHGGIDGQFIKNLTVDTLKIKNGAISNAWVAEQSGGFDISDTSDHQVCPLTVLVRDSYPSGNPAYVMIQFQIRLKQTFNTNSSVDIKVKRGSSSIYTLEAQAGTIGREEDPEARTGKWTNHMYIDTNPIVGNVTYALLINSNNQDVHVDRGKLFIQQIVK